MNMTVFIKDHQLFYTYFKVIKSAKLDTQKLAAWMLEKNESFYFWKFEKD